jgi:beta-alanine--pyruvate transaminase
VLLILDEVITGFGRLGSPFASQEFDVRADLITTAKGLTGGAVPMGAVFVSNAIYDEFMSKPGSAIELFHGYTYSAHPLAVAAGLATQRVYAEDGLFERCRQMAPVFEDALHSLRGEPHVIDIRNYGLMGAVELQPLDGQPGARGMQVLQATFDANLMIRITGDTIAFSPPLIIEQQHISQCVDILRQVLRAL